MSIRVALVFISLALLLQPLAILLSPSSSSSLPSSSISVFVVVCVFFFFFFVSLFLCQEEAFSAAGQPISHTVTATATNPRLLHSERRIHQISSTYNLGNGRVSVNMHFASTLVVDDRSRLSRASVTFFMAEKARLIGVPPPPPAIRNPADFVAPYRGAWTEFLHSIVREGPSPNWWGSVAERIYSTTRVPRLVRNALVHRILGEATAAAHTALALRHRTLSMVFVIEVLIDVNFNNHAWQQHGVVELPPAPVEEEEEEEGEEEEAEEQQQELPLQPRTPPQQQQQQEGVGEEPPPLQLQGLTEAQIEASMVVAPFNDEGGAERCAVCLEDVTRGSTAAWLHCGHFYHASCITGWLRTQGSCPVCRSLI